MLDECTSKWWLVKYINFKEIKNIDENLNDACSKYIIHNIEYLNDVCNNLYDWM